LYPILLLLLLSFIGPSIAANGFYIVNPLNGVNLVTDQMSANQVARLCKAFQGGASNLAIFYKQLCGENILRDPELISNYFPNILTGYADRIEEIK
jgi:hypothetical protein